MDQSPVKLLPQLRHRQTPTEAPHRTRDSRGDPGRKWKVDQELQCLPAIPPMDPPQLCLKILFSFFGPKMINKLIRGFTWCLFTRRARVTTSELRCKQNMPAGERFFMFFFSQPHPQPPQAKQQQVSCFWVPCKLNEVKRATGGLFSLEPRNQKSSSNISAGGSHLNQRMRQEVMQIMLMTCCQWDRHHHHWFYHPHRITGGRTQFDSTEVSAIGNRTDVDQRLAFHRDSTALPKLHDII